MYLNADNSQHTVAQTNYSLNNLIRRCQWLTDHWSVILYFVIRLAGSVSTFSQSRASFEAAEAAV